MGKKKIGGYEDHFQHIEDMAARVSALLEVRMLEKELRSPGGEKSEGSSSVRKELSASRRRLTLASRKLQTRVKATLDRGEVELPFCGMCSIAELSTLEMRILETLLCIQAYDELCEMARELSGTRIIQLKTVLDLLGGSLQEKAEIRKVIGPEKPLFSSGLVLVERGNRLGSEEDFLNMRLNIGCRTFSILMGQDAENAMLEPYSELLSECIPLEELIFPEELKKSVLTLVESRAFHSDVWKDWGLERMRQFRKGTVLVLSGPEGCGRTTLGCSLAGHMGLPCLHVRMDRLLRDSDSPVDVCREIIPEAEYLDAVALVTDADRLFSGRYSSELDVLRRSIMKHDGITILTVSEKMDPAEYLEDCFIWQVEIPMPESEYREKLWRRLLPEELPFAEDADISRIALEHELTPGSIQEAIIGASLLAIAGGRINEGISHEELVACCLNSDLKSQVRKKKRRVMVSFHGDDDRDSDGQEGYFDTEWSRISMEDVILPSRTRRQVMDIISAAHHQEQVFEEWGFREVAGSGHSISALFKGESGTGKTMTAEAVAYELGRKLCTVRGSSVISKWVGESEKNIVRIFREGEDTSVIFFDEADSIFTSRIEQDDSHAEMINRRVSCLLREIELFKGVIILATNYPGLIDGAFQRRIRFKVDFPRPDRKAREAIWRTNLPDGVPLADDVDLSFLAEEFEFTGGQIRSILLRAAFAAAGRGSAVDRELIMQAAEDEVPLVARKEIGFRE